ncbi:MAG: bifunctional adenosylcobinamide kinase/adenosylcobinamide-phosphate guanylyltransferase [Gemmatimonadaceae bacterium]
MLNITLLIGGVRAGKSARALELARARQHVLFVATAQALDDEMANRIALHQAERPASWATLESPVELVRDIEAALAQRQADLVVIDCLTLWVSNLLLSLAETDDAEALIGARATELVAMMARQSPRTWIVVSNEVGLGVVPPTSLGRRYRDALGRVNQIVSAAASHVTLMVAGLQVPVKPT